MAKGGIVKLMKIERSNGNALLVSAFLGFFLLMGINIWVGSPMPEANYDAQYLAQYYHARMFAEAGSISIFLGIGLLLQSNWAIKVAGSSILFVTLYEILREIAMIRVN